MTIGKRYVDPHTFLREKAHFVVEKFEIEGFWATKAPLSLNLSNIIY